MADKNLAKDITKMTGTKNLNVKGFTGTKRPSARVSRTRAGGKKLTKVVKKMGF